MGLAHSERITRHSENGLFRDGFWSIILVTSPLRIWEIHPDVSRTVPDATVTEAQ